MSTFLVTFALLAAAVSASQHALLQVTDTSGCQQQHATGFHNSTGAHSISSNGVPRYYAVNVPDDYDANYSYPVIFDFHSHGATPYDQYLNSMYYDYADGQQYLVIYPQGLVGKGEKEELAWQGAPYAADGVDDLRFTTDLLTHINSTYCINSSRVYASGKSNGGGFVDTLACSDNGDNFAAFAMAAAALYTDNDPTSCTKKRAILETHGHEDCVIPYSGSAGFEACGTKGNGGELPDIDDWVSWWGERNGCEVGDAVNSGDLGGYNTTSYSCGGKVNVMQHYDVFDLGHCWPTTNGKNYDAQRMPMHCADRSLDWTSHVLDFFAKWDHSSAP